MRGEAPLVPWPASSAATIGAADDHGRGFD
jgi:hypothetical protein